MRSGRTSGIAPGALLGNLRIAIHSSTARLARLLDFSDSPVPADPNRARQEGVEVSDYEFTMSLGVRHPDIDPMRITQALGLQPCHIWRSGAERLDSSGVAIGGNHRESYWVCEFPPRPKFSGESIGLESGLTQVLDALRRCIGFMQDLQHGGGTTELFITIYSRGDFRIELLPEESAFLGRLGITMTIEIKPHPVTTAALAAS